MSLPCGAECVIDDKEIVLWKVLQHTSAVRREKREKCTRECSTFNEEGLLQGMRGVSCQVRVWKVEGRGRVMKEKSFGRQSLVCRAGIARIETISPDPQALRAQRGRPQAIAPNDPPFNSGSLTNYVSKNSAHSFGRYWGKRDEWHRRGASHARV